MGIRITSALIDCDNCNGDLDELSPLYCEDCYNKTDALRSDDLQLLRDIEFELRSRSAPERLIDRIMDRMAKF